MNIFPLDFDDSLKNQFIDKLMLAINRPEKENAYDMALACDYIIKESRMV